VLPHSSRHLLSLITLGITGKMKSIRLARLFRLNKMGK